MKLSSYTFYGGNVVFALKKFFFAFAKKFDLVLLFAFFSLLLIFHLADAITSHFLTAAIKFSCCSFIEIRLLSFSSPALALSLLSMSV